MNIEVLTDNLPPPEDAAEFNERLRREFGELNNRQRVRVVWGMDESNKQWCGGKYILKYPIACIRNVRLRGYVCGGKLYSSADEITPKPGELIIPLYDNYEKYIGYPAWIVETYYPAEYFGAPEEWHAERMRLQQTWGVDVLGEYPADGRYQEGCKLTMERDGELIARPLSDETFSIICAMVRGEERGVRALIEMRAQQTTDNWREIVEDVFSDVWSESQTIIRARHSVS